MTTIMIDDKLCCGDKFCVLACPAGCFRMKEGKADTIPLAGKACIECGQCVAVCPKAAIRLNGELPPEATENKASARELVALLKGRRSIRNYMGKPVPHEELERALDAVRYAPTGKNSQDIEWLGLEGQDKLRELAGKIINAMPSQKNRLAEAFEQGHDPIFRGAPCALFAHSTTGAYDLADVDGGIAGGYLELLLHSMGLGSCWAGYALGVIKNSRELCDYLGLPQNRTLVAALMVGYPALRYKRIPVRKPLRLTWI